MAKELQNADMIMNVMNRSHGDSLIGIVKHYGNLEKTVGVSITSIDTEGFDCMVNLSDGSNSFTRIIFTEPLDTASKAEPIFVSMAYNAAVALNSNDANLKESAMKAGIRKNQLSTDLPLYGIILIDSNGLNVENDEKLVTALGEMMETVRPLLTAQENKLRILLHNTSVKEQHRLYGKVKFGKKTLHNWGVKLTPSSIFKYEEKGGHNTDGSVTSRTATNGDKKSVQGLRERLGIVDELKVMILTNGNNQNDYIDVNTSIDFLLNINNMNSEGILDNINNVFSDVLNVSSPGSNSSKL